MDDREHGATFAPNDIGWLDFETRCPTPIETGAYRYMCDAEAIVVAYAIGDGPAQTIDGDLRWDMLPFDFQAHHNRVRQGRAVWAAWNAGFDAAVWNYATPDWPELVPEHIIDVMAQATAAGLPGRLDLAGRYVGAGGKHATGKELIRLFSEGGAAPHDHPDRWEEFLAYAANDVGVMRTIFRRTLQLPRAEWMEYWAAEHINRRGVGCDLQLAAAAAAMADVDRRLSAQELAMLTNGAVTAATQVQRLSGWLRGVLAAEGRALMLRREQEVDEETGEIVRPAKHSLTRQRIRLLIAHLSAMPLNPAEAAALQALTIRLYGGSTTLAKFTRMQQQAVDGVLMGQYVFGGAPQTGRFSSRGVQIHNLMRDALPYELDAVDALIEGCGHTAFAGLGDDTPVCRKLAMLVRPTLVPTMKQAFCWGDWSQIEARITPWLAGVESRLDIFREVDDDPSKPDLYTRTAAALSGVPVAEVTPEMRQRGKVAELALGFCGGKGALQNMAANYGMALSDHEAQGTVLRWRDENPWAIDFSRQLWEAMRAAHAAPGHFVPAGKIQFAYLRDYLGGSLLCRLPSGRMLTYRRLRWEMVDEIDEYGVVQDRKLELMFLRGRGHIKLWPGFFVENVTQACAADILRGTLLRLIEAGLDVRAHTHDEVLLQVAPDDAKIIAERLQTIMEQGFTWSDGLPLRAETVTAWHYTKCKGAYGL